MRRFELTDKQFDSLELSTRRSLILQIMIIHTPKYQYTLGAKGNLWTLVRYDRNESIGKDKWGAGYTPEVIDSWI